MRAPEAIGLETSSVCQLRCPSCPTTMGAIAGAVGSGFLKLADFKKIVDGNPDLKLIELSNYGEAFLNPDLLAILEHGHRRGVALTLRNGVNLNTVKDEVLEGLVKYGVRAITCSIDGATAQTYAVYRRRGDLSVVLRNIRKLNAFKASYGSKRPVLTWQFVVFGHNEHELAEARGMARDLGMKFRPKMSWGDVSPVKDSEAVKRATGWDAADRGSYEDLHGQVYARHICHQLWKQPRVNWDGAMLGCCFNFWGDFGANVLSAGLAAVFNGEKIAYARRMLMGREPERADIPCTTCTNFKSMKARGNWITEAELRPSKLGRLYEGIRRLLTAAARSLRPRREAR
jgi:MoaA/NifB/PqqE/SkfB family radical SAM enzyme